VDTCRTRSAAPINGGVDRNTRKPSRLLCARCWLGASYNELLRKQRVPQGLGSSQARRGARDVRRCQVRRHWSDGWDRPHHPSTATSRARCDLNPPSLATRCGKKLGRPRNQAWGRLRTKTPTVFWRSKTWGFSRSVRGWLGTRHSLPGRLLLIDHARF
jgi:hypothetical protein